MFLAQFVHPEVVILGITNSQISHTALTPTFYYSRFAFTSIANFSFFLYYIIWSTTNLSSVHINAHTEYSEYSKK